MSLKTFSSKSSLNFSTFSPSQSPFPSIFIAHLCTSSQSHRLRRQEEESKNVKVSVWWDFENCHLPSGVNVYKVAHAITEAVRTNGIKGPVQITAIGDVLQLSRENQEALTSTGINLLHVPQGGKNSADRSLLVDLMYWVSQNPPPAHLFLISGDRDFAGVLHRLRMKNYNVLLASTDNAPSVLCSAASIMWRWNALVRGENLTGKVFNQPPDGPYGSWYGHYKAPLEDPFAEKEAPSAGEGLAEAASETKIRPIPKAVIEKIGDILNLNPKGMSLTKLRYELLKSNVGIDKDFYGQLVAHGVIAKSEQFQPKPVMSSDPAVVDRIDSPTKPLKSEGGDLPTSASVCQNPSVPSSLQLSKKGPAENLQQSSSMFEKAVRTNTQQPINEIGASHLIGQKNGEVINVQEAQETLPPLKRQNYESEVGFFKKIWRRWFNYTNGSTSDVLDKSPMSQDDPRLKNISSDALEKKVRFVKTSSPEHDPVSASCSPSNTESSVLENTTVTSEPQVKTSEKSPGFMNWIKILIWGNDVNSYFSTDQPCGKHSGVCELFSDDSLWREIESFLGSHEGSRLVSQSRTREEMARNLQKGGTLALKSLNECDMVQLVDMLISEKKWVKEQKSEALPFKLTLAVGKDASLGVSTASNGLRSLFMCRESLSNPKKQLESNGDGSAGKTSNISHIGLSQPVSPRNFPRRPRKEILSDCQKLSSEIVKEHPKGYNIGSFRKLFLERYGYHLDVQKLGYQKLASLLQIMPGVKLESTYILPCSKAPECSSILNDGVDNFQERSAICNSKSLGTELSDKLKGDDSDSTWDPVENSSFKRNENEEKRSISPYEPSISYDDLSDSEEKSPAKPKRPAKYRDDSDDSSLIQILEQWNSGNDGVSTKGKSENEQDRAKNVLQPSESPGPGTKTGSSVGSYGSNHRSQKSYSFVAASGYSDSDANNPNKLIDGIIGSLKKSGGSRVHS